MTYTSPDAKEALEKAAPALFEKLDWATANAYHETYEKAPDASAGGPALGRATRNEVILRPRLEAALARLP